MNRYDRRARRGIAWLDQHAGPTWPDRVEPGLLDLVSQAYCVLGQVFSERGALRGWTGYQYACRVLNAPGFRTGFVPLCPTERAFRRQEEAWLRALAPIKDARRQSALEAKTRPLELVG